MCFTAPTGDTSNGRTQPLICLNKQQISSWGREGGWQNLNKLLKKLPEYVKEGKNVLLH